MDTFPLSASANLFFIHINDKNWSYQEPGSEGAMTLAIKDLGTYLICLSVALLLLPVGGWVESSCLTGPWRSP
jgi:hypothetical protein